jgi:hypothetical protein
MKDRRRASRASMAWTFAFGQPDTPTHWLRGDARGRDGGVRQELAAGMSKVGKQEGLMRALLVGALCLWAPICSAEANLGSAGHMLPICKEAFIYKPKPAAPIAWEQGICIGTFDLSRNSAG